MFAVAVHNIYSSVKLQEVSEVILAFPEVDIFIMSRAYSTAAQSGVPDVEKKLFTSGRKVLYLPDIGDINEVLSPDYHYMIVPTRMSEKKIDVEYIRRIIRGDGRVVISVSGGDTPFTLKELEYGEPVNIGIDRHIPPAASIAIILAKIFNRL